MTAMLVSVTGTEEAELALRAEADVLDLKDPRRGALGALDPMIVQEVVRLYSGRVRLSATLGDPPPERRRTLAAARAATGIDILKLGLRADDVRPDLARLIDELRCLGPAVVTVWLVEGGLPGPRELTRLAAAGVRGVMLDTADKQAGSLRERLSPARLRGFVQAARGAGLWTGLAGSLRLQDVAPLLALAPDYLGFRGALCREGREGTLDIERARRIRAAIPQHAGRHGLALAAAG